MSCICCDCHFSVLFPNETLATAQIKLNDFPIERRMTTIDILSSSDKRNQIMTRLRSSDIVAGTRGHGEQISWRQRSDNSEAANRYPSASLLRDTFCGCSRDRIFAACEQTGLNLARHRLGGRVSGLLWSLGSQGLGRLQKP